MYFFLNRILIDCSAFSTEKVLTCINISIIIIIIKQFASNFDILVVLTDVKTLSFTYEGPFSSIND